MRPEIPFLCRILLAVFLLLPSGLWAKESPVIREIPLRIDNPLPHARTGEPVTSGVPLPQPWRITDPESLILVGLEGKPVPAQIRPLSRWGDLHDGSAPLRWVLIDFQADVPPGGDSCYRLKIRKEKEASPKSETRIEVDESAKGIVLDTGPLRFTVPRDRFGPMTDMALKEGQNTVEWSGGKADGFVLWKDGHPWSAAWGSPDEVAVEESGPLRTVIRIHGRFFSREGETLTGGDARPKPDEEGRPKAENLPLEYTVRLHAYAGKPWVRIVCTLENHGNGLLRMQPMNDVFLQGAELEIPLPDEKMTIFAEGKKLPLTSGDRLELVQSHTLRNKTDESENFFFSLERNGKTIRRGKRSHGWLSVGTERRGITVAVTRFWERFPKSLSVEDKTLKIGILPRGKDPHFFSGGWHMTDEVWLRFRGGRTEDGTSARFIRDRATPLFAQASPFWYAETGAWDLIAPRLKNREMGKAEKNYEQYQQMLVDPSASKEGLTLESLWEKRHLGRTHYGWSRFGDIAWRGEGGPFSALHYDWPYILWLQFLRNGDLRFLRLAWEMTDHSADMDQIHSDGDHGGGVWWWEELDDGEDRHRSLNTSGLILSHTWSGGYALGYLMTGEKRYLEAARRGAEAARRHWAEAIAGKKIVEGQARSQGWSILLLVNLYRITGEKRLLMEANAIFENSLLYTEDLPEPPGTGGIGALSYAQSYKKEEYGGKAVVTFITYHLEPLCALHHEMALAGMDTRTLENFLVRSLDWLKEYAYVGGKTQKDGRISLLTLSYATDLHDRSKNMGGQLAHNIHVAGAFGYGALMLRKEDPQKAERYLEFARHLFRDLMLYRTVEKKEKNDFHDPQQFAPVGWGWLPTATKEIGWIGRGGQTYLYVEYLLKKEKNRRRNLSRTSP